MTVSLSILNVNVQISNVHPLLPVKTSHVYLNKMVIHNSGNQIQPMLQLIHVVQQSFQNLPPLLAVTLPILTHVVLQLRQQSHHHHYLLPLTVICNNVKAVVSHN